MASDSLDVDPDRLAGREYDVHLEFRAEYRVRVTAGPEAWQAEERAEEIAFPGGPTDVADWDLLFAEADAVRNIWMDDPAAPEAATWLDEPHVPSEETYWDDSRHFEEVAHRGE